VVEVLAAMAADLDAPRAVAAVQGWVDATLGFNGHLADASDEDAALTMHALLDAALGLAL
ncbi:MAG TPA: cysteine--1-D-myo-inosityl 2-amino-2-deoxy-alpha-D-glucopyranoside ligase, partial [Nocardioides sp.]|nr:cysteine--1-D-myo-inosityl 2-amino-2-deoxy-alpha-D-glucopyranoside ligase [Nocardioides sp.]